MRSLIFLGAALCVSCQAATTYTLAELQEERDPQGVLIARHYRMEAKNGEHLASYWESCRDAAMLAKAARQCVLDHAESVDLKGRLDKEIAQRLAPKNTSAPVALTARDKDITADLRGR